AAPLLAVGGLARALHRPRPRAATGRGGCRPPCTVPAPRRGPARAGPRGSAPDPASRPAGRAARCGGRVMNDGALIEVAQVVTRFIAGAGGVALRGALELDPAVYHVTVVTGARSALLDRAEAAGMDTVVEPTLAAPIAPVSDVSALARLTALFRARGFDVVHTHSAKAGALGRIAAHRAGVPLVAHTYHGFPFHDFQDPSRHAAYVGIERRLARITDEVFAIGTGVATEALRRGLARPDALDQIPPAVSGRPGLT